MTENFDCPDCGAPIQPDGAATTVKCPFCGSVVIVPTNLRAPAMPPPPMPSVSTYVVEFPATMPAPPMARPAARGGGCVALFILIIVLVSVGLPLYLDRQELFQGLADPATATPRATRTPVPTPTPPFAAPVLTIDGKAAGAGQFKDPRALALDPAGNIYVTDSKPGRVLKFDPQGHFVSSWPLGVDYPQVLAVDHAGNIYTLVSDAIRKYNGSTGALLDTFTFQDRNFGFSGYNAVTVLPDGTLLGSLAHTGNLIRLDTQGKELNRFANVLDGHSSDTENTIFPVADPQGDIYLLGTDTDTVYKLTPGGQFVSRISGQGDAPGLLENPRGFAVDGLGRVYVGDSNGIQLFDPAGRYLGQIKAGGYPESLAVDAQGQVVALVSGQVVKFRLNAVPTPPIVVGAAPTLTPQAVPTATPIPGIGSTVTFDGWVISLARVETHPTLLLKADHTTLTADGRFYLVWLDARNQQTSKHSLNQDFRIELADKYDDAYDDLTALNPDSLGAYLQQEGRDSLDDIVQPQALTHPLLVYGIPDDVTPLHLVISAAVGDAQIRFNLATK